MSQWCMCMCYCVWWCMMCHWTGCVWLCWCGTCTRWVVSVHRTDDVLLLYQSMYTMCIRLYSVCWCVWMIMLGCARVYMGGSVWYVHLVVTTHILQSIECCVSCLWVIMHTTHPMRVCVMSYPSEYFIYPVIETITRCWQRCVYQKWHTYLFLMN